MNPVAKYHGNRWDILGSAHSQTIKAGTQICPEEDRSMKSQKNGFNRNRMQNCTKLKPVICKILGTYLFCLRTKLVM
jgi:hypothetical protein